MKIRTDFVTNSSSSSFIIGSKDEDITKDFVFNMIKDFYREMRAQWDVLAEAADGLGIKIVDKNGYRRYEFPGDNYSEKNRPRERLIRQTYGIGHFDTMPIEEHDPTNFETYADYEKYWLDKIKSNPDTYIHAPFTIVDYMVDKSYYPIHEGGKYALKRADNVPEEDGDGLLGWYMPCASEIGETWDLDETYCDYCHYNYGSEDCKKVQERIKSGEITNKNSIVTLLGRVCVHSECGYIPDHVVERLMEVARFSCNHMG